MTRTPNAALDVLVRVAALAPELVTLSGDTRNAWSGPERPSVASGVPLKAIFAEVTPASRNDLHNDGRLRSFEVQLLFRGSRNKFSETRQWASDILDAVDLTGPWVGPAPVSAKWMDLRSGDAAPLYLGPGESDAEYFAVNLIAVLDG